MPASRRRESRSGDFKDERFVHPAALFAPDDAKLAEWLAKNMEHGSEDDDAPADGPMGGIENGADGESDPSVEHDAVDKPHVPEAEDGGNATDAELEGLDEADADTSTEDPDTAYGIAAE
ncbi:hypothetical protein [Rhizobium leguminosarum]|uniref:hypothetical protein n=1 Tax=Rhizobium leguminosarum TaxID=384 RepID=UPI0021BC0576|nr:hypothetical protein [Rhizobium leguminosarum]